MGHLVSQGLHSLKHCEPVFGQEVPIVTPQQDVVIEAGQIIAVYNVGENSLPKRMRAKLR